ncbi:MAG: TPM domain-containing protein [Rhodoferax sp.]
MLNRIARLMRHRWMEDAHRIVSTEMLERLRAKVEASENMHTGEIRICIESALPSSYLLRAASLPTIIRQRALTQFGKLGVWDTEHNNGVLIYLLLSERQIELVADRGLSLHVGPQVWQEMVKRLSLALRDGKFEDGLTMVIADVTEALKAHFPLADGQHRRNELPDQPELV